MPLKTALKIKQLTKQNLQLLIAGNIPVRQPGYKDYREKDSLVQHYFQEIARFPQTSIVTDSTMTEKLTKILPRDIHFNGSVDFVRQTKREMTDGSKIKFIWNKSNQVKTVSLTIKDRRYRSSYWLNPENGNIIKNESDTVAATLPPYGSVILFASVRKEIPADLLTKEGFSEKELQPVTEIKEWDIKIDKYQTKNSSLFDWSRNQEVNYKSSISEYRANFYINKKKDRGYVLNMGDVYFTAKVRLNGKTVGKRIWPPYSLDVTFWLKNGNNDIEIVITSSNRNKFVGEGINGNPKYREFEGLEKTLMPSGLFGPVVISEYARTE
jgi:hypothetical protein